MTTLGAQQGEHTHVHIIQSSAISNLSMCGRAVEQIPQRCKRHDQETFRSGQQIHISIASYMGIQMTSRRPQPLSRTVMTMSGKCF